MKLYHGSNIKILTIDLEKGRLGKDFGKGFYLSSEYEQAERMAQITSVRRGGEPMITTFVFDETKLCDKNLKVKIFEGYSIEWAQFILKNRLNNTPEQAHDYDIVIGPIADDKVGVQIRKLKDGSIDKKEFLNRLKYMKGITYQYYFGSEIAIKYLKKI